MFESEGFPTFIASAMQISHVKFLMWSQFKQAAEGLPTFLTHTRHFFSVKFEWLICIKFPLREFPHVWHLTGPSPEWVIRWSKRAKAFWKLVLQLLHLKSFCTLWTPCCCLILEWGGKAALCMVGLRSYPLLGVAWCLRSWPFQNVFPTFPVYEWLLSTMLLLKVVKVRADTKASVLCRTHVLLLPRVCSFMLSKVQNIFPDRATHVTDKGFPAYFSGSPLGHSSSRNILLRTGFLHSMPAAKDGRHLGLSCGWRHIYPVRHQGSLSCSR
jgi:hypothetical protein